MKKIIEIVRKDDIFKIIVDGNEVEDVSKIKLEPQCISLLSSLVDKKIRGITVNIPNEITSSNNDRIEALETRLSTLEERSKYARETLSKIIQEWEALLSETLGFYGFDLNKIRKAQRESLF